MSEPRRTVTLPTGEKIAKAGIEWLRAVACVCPYCGGCCEFPNGGVYFYEYDDHAEWGRTPLICLECGETLAYPANPLRRLKT